MGSAAHNRGSKSIARSIARSYGLDDPEDHAKLAPVKRPSDWGSKTYQRALRYAVGYARWMESRGRALGGADLIDAIILNIRCGKQTAKNVADEVLCGSAGASSSKSSSTKEAPAPGKQGQEER